MTVHVFTGQFPATAKRLPCADLVSGQRRLWWPNIKPTQVQRMSRFGWLNYGYWFNVVSLLPANTIHRPNAGLMLVHCLRKWHNIEPPLGRWLVFAGICVSIHWSPSSLSMYWIDQESPHSAWTYIMYVDMRSEAELPTVSLLHTQQKFCWYFIRRYKEKAFITHYSEKDFVRRGKT